MLANLEYKTECVEDKILLKIFAVKFNNQSLRDQVWKELQESLTESIARQLFFLPFKDENIINVKVSIGGIGAYINKENVIGICFDKDGFSSGGKVHEPKEIMRFVCEDVIFKYCGAEFRKDWQPVVYENKDVYYYSVPIQLQTEDLIPNINHTIKVIGNELTIKHELAPTDQNAPAATVVVAHLLDNAGSSSPTSKDDIQDDSGVSINTTTSAQLMHNTTTIDTGPHKIPAFIPSKINSPNAVLSYSTIIPSGSENIKLNLMRAQFKTPNDCKNAISKLLTDGVTIDDIASLVNVDTLEHSDTISFKVSKKCKDSGFYENKGTIAFTSGVYTEKSSLVLRKVYQLLEENCGDFGTLHFGGWQGRSVFFMKQKFSKYLKVGFKYTLLLQTSDDSEIIEETLDPFFHDREDDITLRDYAKLIAEQSHASSEYPYE